MELSFDYYNNLEQVDLYLCNPDGKELFPLRGRNRKLMLRFNDLSELTFDTDAVISSVEETEVAEAYDYIRTKRLVFVTGIGWFQISSVQETDDGINKYKSVTCESLQAVFKNKGFLSEERVYCFYNPYDPLDDEYNANKEDAIPSVVGQLYKQLGIGISRDVLGGTKSISGSSGWAISYINHNLIFSGDGSIFRTFESNTTYGYDWMVKNVEDAFGVIVCFDFKDKTIQVMYPSEVTEKADVIYTFSNFMKSIDIQEDANDIVTVLNCTGDGCNISTVNPTGTGYICDFSYYMDETDHKWMSQALIDKLKSWKAACDSKKDEYTKLIKEQRENYKEKTSLETKLTSNSITLQDIKNAQSNRSSMGDGTAGGICGTVIVERVLVGENSMHTGSRYNKAKFPNTVAPVSELIAAYTDLPTWDNKHKKYVFGGQYKVGTPDEIVSGWLSDDDGTTPRYRYFQDPGDGLSYCKLLESAEYDKDTKKTTYKCKGFDRYVACLYPTLDDSGKTTYSDQLQWWVNLREKLVENLTSQNEALDKKIQVVDTKLKAISGTLNLLSYLNDSPELVQELSCYWIEGDYANENIAVTDNTTLEQEIDLSNELLKAGETELSKVSQPRFTFTIESINALGQIEFKEQMAELELGKVITIEREEGVWYYPALLEISIDLDNHEDFSLTFANATHLDDWGFTYADLISAASATSRKVSSNWQELTAYSKEKKNIDSIIKKPLDTTLRAATANMENQKFTIDQNGILGRKKSASTDSIFDNEQLRIINNEILYTDDNWETAKAALGKIYYTDPNTGEQTTAYGLIAETIIGSLFLGDMLTIRDTSGMVNISGEGIVIKKPRLDSDGQSTGDYDVVFRATKDGQLTVSGYATENKVNGEVKKINESLTIMDGKIDSKVSETTFNTLGDQVKKNTADITETAKQIDLKVNQTEFDKLGDVVSENQSNITQNANSIKAKVDSHFEDETKTFGWELVKDHFVIKSNGIDVMKVDKNGMTLAGGITATAGNIAGWEIGSGTGTNRHDIQRWLIGFPTSSKKSCSGMLAWLDDVSGSIADADFTNLCHTSLVPSISTEDRYSYARFWCGAECKPGTGGTVYFNLSNSEDNGGAKFLVLNDGSVFAQALEVNKALYVFSADRKSRYDVADTLRELIDRVTALEKNNA